MRAVSPPHRAHRDEAGELWMAFVSDPNGNPVGLCEQRNPVGV